MRADDPHTALSRLTPGQLEVLERVAQFKSSKQIARELGISWHTVDQRLKRVQAILDVASRFDAARIYTEHQGHCEEFSQAIESEDNSSINICDELVYQGSGLTDLLTPRHQEMSPDSWGQPAMRSDGLLAESQALYFAGVEHSSQSNWISALLTAGSRNELTSFWRVVIIVGIAVSAILSLAVMVNLVEGLSRLF